MYDIIELTDTEIHKQIGKKIKEWRLQINMSQKRLAKDAGLSLITVQQLEYGNRVTLETLIRVLRILGRLDELTPFFKEEPVSPILAAKIEHSTGKHRRKRASSNNNN